MIEIAVFHVRDVGLRPLLPLAHGVRMLARIVLDRHRRTTVGVAFAKHRVHRRTETLAETCLERLFFVGGGVLG